ncbi:hypothetical protein Tsp_10354 [Trichinella spiralis]|uniref:hypothetical protein n=1 Tax=Trichinella spiralis TaxID=6334 RepID=UPI0001EFE54A|nr:hypothetical protein Tsp_10354 [Trichinella spiralis]
MARRSDKPARAEWQNLVPATSCGVQDNHRPLVRIFHKKRDITKIINNRLIRWTLKGKENYCADALSRLPMQTEEPYTVENREIKRITMMKLDDLWLSEKEIIRRRAQDKVLREVKKCIGDNWLEKNR